MTFPLCFATKVAHGVASGQLRFLAMTEISDRLAVTELLSRYFAAVDDKRLDLSAVEAAFAGEGRLVRPNGSAIVGPQDILASQTQSFGRFRATHHMTSDYVIKVDGDTAELRANLTAMHLWGHGEGDPHSIESYFLAGDVIRAGARRTPSGWRLTELEVYTVWRTGGGFSSMAQTGGPPPAAS